MIALETGRCTVKIEVCSAYLLGMIVIPKVFHTRGMKWQSYPNRYEVFLRNDYHTKLSRSKVHFELSSLQLLFSKKEV